MQAIARAEPELPGIPEPAYHSVSIKVGRGEYRATFEMNSEREWMKGKNEINP
jgi:hypothetical protein